MLLFLHKEKKKSVFWRSLRWYGNLPLKLFFKKAPFLSHSVFPCGHECSEEIKYERMSLFCNQRTENRSNCHFWRHQTKRSFSPRFIILQTSSILWFLWGMLGVCVCQWEREKQREKEREREYSSFLPMTLFQQYWSPIGRQTGRKVQFLHQDWFHLKVFWWNASKVVEGHKRAERMWLIIVHREERRCSEILSGFCWISEGARSLRRVIWL